MTFAYEGYETARFTTDLAAEAVAVAQENYRVQDVRYRAGASTIIDLLSAQNGLSDAEACSGAGSLCQPAGARRTREHPGPATVPGTP